MYNDFEMMWSGFLEWGGRFIANHALNVLVMVLVSVLLLTVGSFLARLAIRGFFRLKKGRKWSKVDIEKRQKTVISIFKNVWRVLIVIGLIWGLIEELFPNANLSAVIAGLGVLSIAISFGAQSFVKDIISGMSIIGENQYRVGDIVDLGGGSSGGPSGTVEKVGLRTTILRDVEGNVHFVPNGLIGHVVNKTVMYSNSRFVLKLDSNVDLDKVKKLIDETGVRLASAEEWKERVIEAPHFGTVQDVDGRSISITVKGKTLPADQWAVNNQMRQELIKVFKKHGIKFAKTVEIK